MTLTRESAEGLAGEWLLDMTVSGQVFRFATAPVDVVDRTGATLRYAEGLGELVQGLGSSGSADQSIPVDLEAPEAWNELIQRFTVIERSRCVLRRWFPGQRLEAARVVLIGQLSGFTYGEPFEGVRFSITRRVSQQSRQLPTSGMVVDETTWPVRTLGGWVVDDKTIGAYYPIIIGRPGFVSAFETHPAVPGVLVETDSTSAIDDTDRLLFAGHGVRDTAVTVFDYSDEGAIDTASPSVLELADNQDRVTSVVELTAASGLATLATSGRIYYVGMGAEGGLDNPFGPGGLRGAADVIEWLLRTWTDVVIDGPRFAAVRDLLNLYKIDTFLNEPVDPLEWMNAEILPLLPVEPRQAETGLYFYVFPTDVRTVDAVARLDADTGQIERASALQIDSISLVNEVTVEFQPDRVDGGFRRRVTVSAGAGLRSDELAGELATDTRVIGSYRAKLSQERFGRLPRTVSANAVWDPATAVRIAQDVIHRQALPQRFVDYTAGPELEALSPGQIVRVNDSAVQLSDELALILDVQVGGPDVLLSFELLDDPTLTRRFVGTP